MNELVWWFGQNTLAALLMIPCVVLACRLFRDRPAVQHLLWLVILLKLVTPPIVVWPWSVEELRSMAWSQLSVHQGANQGASRATFPVAPVPELIELPIESAMVPQVSVSSIEPSSLPALVPVVTDNANEKAETTTRTNWGSIVATTAILVWLFGAIVCAVSQLRRLARYARLVRSGEVAPSHLKAEVASVASLLRMQAPVSLIVKGIVSPFLWCVGSATLAWPDSLTSQADVVRSRGIIAHELAHLRRRDHWITWLELAASILWWWNPLFWYVRRQLRETAEMSCDALAIAANPVSRREYAELLLRLSSQSTNGVPVPVIAMGASNVASFERRLKMILSSNVSGNLSWRGALALAVLTVIALPYWSLAQTTNRNRSDSPQSQDSVSEQSVVKKPANPSAYRGMDTALLRRWHQLEGEKQSISESRVATLRSAIGRFIDGLPASQIQLTQNELADLKRLQALGTDKVQHTASETQAFIESVFAIHGEPIQMAFNEAPWLGAPGNAVELNQLPFGPPDSSGLRVALVCQKGEFIFGDSAQLDIRLWNTGNETILVGIGRDGPGLYPKLELQATDREGHQIATKFGPDSQMLKDTRFARSWQLRPGDTTDVSGYRLRVGSSVPREAEVFPQWHTLIEMPDAKSGDEIFLAGVIPSLARTARSSNEKLQTGSIRIKAIAPEDVEIWSAHSAGTWPMPGGVTLEVKRELFHGADVATSAVLTWPKDAKGTTHAFSSYVASDAFGNREPWHVAWERSSSSIWTIRGNLGDHGPGRAKLFCLSRIDFADKSKIVTTTWYHRPDEMPKGIQLAFEKVFEPLPTTPRLASEAEGSTQVEQAHDVRPIQELLHGVWKSSSNEPSVQMTFPEQDTGDVQWTIDYGKGTPAIEAKLSRIRVPANNAIRLWIPSSQLSNVDERDIVGTVRRGPDSTLLLDITGSPKYPEYKKELGIVLTQMPPANATSEMSRNQGDKNSADEKAKVSANEKVEPW